MKIRFYVSIPFITVALLCSCASYKTQYSKEGRQWRNNVLPEQTLLKHTLYLIGDAGKPTLMGTTPVLRYLKPKLEAESKNSSVLFLGDNIYEYGMPPKEDEDARQQAEININAQLEILIDFKGTPIFVPGNHDWRGWGLKGLKDQEKYIESYLNKHKGVTDKSDWENYFLPDDGCSGPSVVELGDVVIIVVDSQWWLADWSKEPKINEGCEARNRATFEFVFENVIRKYRNKNVVIAMHHPLFTYGPHGGGYSAKQHLFPLTDIRKKLYVPLPVIGSLAVFYRSLIGSKQDVANPNYKELRSSLMAAVKKNGNFTFVSGHEHALEYIENENQNFIVSGSGAKNSALHLGKGAEFVSGRAGFSKLLFYEGGETWTQFWEVNNDGTDATLVFQKKIKDKLQNGSEQSNLDYTEYEQHNDSSKQFVTRNEVKPVGPIHEFLLGSHYRDLYREKYPFPVLDLSTFNGGVMPVKQGGGNQTNSLRVRDSVGRDFVFRGMTKDVSRFLPFPFNKMVAAKYLVEDNFLSTHPFAPLAIPSLADAIQVYHTDPRLYYVPVQPALGNYNSIFGGTLCLVEERPSGKKWKQADFFGHPDEIIGTPDVVENILKSNDNKVDEEWALRTRLLDFIIGDWDRHDDQWTWARIKDENDKNLYRPIPRDRDQAFSRYDGFIPAVAAQTLPFLRQLQTYGPDMPNMKWTTWSARLFDHTFLNELSWEQWEAQIKFIQQQLSDEDIEGAFKSWPEKAQEISAPGLIKGLKARRNNLMRIARKHYEFLAQSVDIIGTEEKERFEVERLNDHQTKITVYEITKKGRPKQRVYERTFDNAFTKSINLYGNGDDDEFILTGDVRKGITVRLIGGLGKDEFLDKSFVKRGSKKTLVFDDLRKNEVIPSKETKDKRTSDYGYNLYDRRGYDSQYDIVMPLPILGFNPDDGVLAGASFNIINYGFKKDPYSANQQVGGSYAFETNAFKLNYRGDFIGTFNKFDFLLEARYHGPTYAFNFATIGNNSKRIVDNPDFYRVRQSSIRLYPAIKKRTGGNSGYFSLGPVLETSEIQQTPGRFISIYGLAEDKDIFDRKYYAGAQFDFNYNNVDNFFSPHRGVRFYTAFNWTANVKEEDKKFTSLRYHLAFYKSVDRKENVILASQLGGGVNFGTGYEFFQMPTIGGQLGLRGYRTERFYGETTFFQNTDLRVRLLSSYNPVVPLTVGVFGSFDYGRVWLDDDPSENWHYSYGGGIWISPVDALVFSIGTFIPKEDFEESPRVVFRLGFGF